MSAASALMGLQGGQSAGAAGSSQKRFGEMSSEDFVKILVEELSHQDPMAPNDTKQVLEQLSSLRNIESQMDLQESLQALVAQNGVAQASGMIGKTVEGLGEDSQSLSGRVVSVRVMDGKAVLELDTGKQLPMERVTKIASANPATAAGPGALMV